MALRVLLYDRTCKGPLGPGGAPLPGLSAIWSSGARVYRALGRIGRAYGVSSWDEAARAIEDATRDGTPVRELQYWGHGRFGCVLVDRERIDRSALGRARFVAALTERLERRDDALVWLRTCEAFGGHVGHDFARALAEATGVRVAGHTYVIGFWQSGLHGLAPGAQPTWDPAEGIGRGTAAAPELGAWSTPHEPHTIHALEGSVPPAWFDRGRPEG